MRRSYAMCIPPRIWFGLLSSVFVLSSETLPRAKVAAQTPLLCEPFASELFSPPRHSLELEDVQEGARTPRRRRLWGQELGGDPSPLLREASHGALDAIQLPVALRARVRFQQHPALEGEPPDVYLEPSEAGGLWVAVRGQELRVARIPDVQDAEGAAVAIIELDPLRLFPHHEDIPEPADEWWCRAGSPFACSRIRVVGMEAVGARTLAVHTSRMESYCGGFGSFHMTHLVHDDGLRLRHILALPTAYYVLHAGEWNAVGTRQRWVYEGELTIQMDSNSLSSPPDIIVGVGGQSGRRHLRWDTSSGAYRCHP